MSYDEQSPEEPTYFPRPKASLGSALLFLKRLLRSTAKSNARLKSSDKSKNKIQPSHLTSHHQMYLLPTPCRDIDRRRPIQSYSKAELRHTMALSISKRKKNSAGLGFWTGYEDRYRTPPPTLLPRESSSALSDEMTDTQGSSMLTSDHPALRNINGSRSRSTTPLANYGAPTAGDVARRVNNKRRRDDDFDPAFTKRRAVSPGMSVQSSPVLPQSPVMNSDKAWGKPPPSRNNGNGERSNSGSSISGTKRVGLQGMTETNDAIMSMSID